MFADVSTSTAPLDTLYNIVVVADASEAAANRPRREKKEAFKIDFLTPDEKDIKTRQKALFASAPETKKKGSGKRRSKGKEDKPVKTTLPNDMHFSKKQLVTLFLKPKFSVCSQILRDAMRADSAFIA